jgi:hypothetical protein
MARSMNKPIQGQFFELTWHDTLSIISCSTRLEGFLGAGLKIENRVEINFYNTFFLLKIY